MIICENNTVFAKSDFWSKTRQPAPVSPKIPDKIICPNLACFVFFSSFLYFSTIAVVPSLSVLFVPTCTSMVPPSPERYILTVCMSCFYHYMHNLFTHLQYYLQESLVVDQEAEQRSTQTDQHVNITPNQVAHQLIVNGKVPNRQRQSKIKRCGQENHDFDDDTSLIRTPL